MGSAIGAACPWTTGSRGENDDTHYASATRTSSKPTRRTRLCALTVLSILERTVLAWLWRCASRDALWVVPASRSATGDACHRRSCALPSSCLHVSRLHGVGDASHGGVDVEWLTYGQAPVGSHGLLWPSEQGEGVHSRASALCTWANTHRARGIGCHIHGYNWLQVFRRPQDLAVVIREANCGIRVQGGQKNAWQSRTDVGRKWA
jgi:hypothetical protein